MIRCVRLLRPAAAVAVVIDGARRFPNFTTNISLPAAYLYGVFAPEVLEERKAGIATYLNGCVCVAVARVVMCGVVYDRVRERHVECVVKGGYHCCRFLVHSCRLLTPRFLPAPPPLTHATHTPLPPLLFAPAALAGIPALWDELARYMGVEATVFGNSFLSFGIK